MALPLLGIVHTVIVIFRNGLFRIAVGEIVKIRLKKQFPGKIEDFFLVYSSQVFFIF
jgi:hypothetical protein